MQLELFPTSRSGKEYQLAYFLVPNRGTELAKDARFRNQQAFGQAVFREPIHLLLRSTPGRWENFAMTVVVDAWVTGLPVLNADAIHRS